MGFGDRLRRLVGRGAPSAARCAADWRRPDGYWRCTRPAGHGGRHRMRSALRQDIGAGPGRELRPLAPRVGSGESGDGGVVAG